MSELTERPHVEQILPPGTCRRERAERVGPDGQESPCSASFLVLSGQAITITDCVMPNYLIHYFLRGEGRYRDERGCDGPIRPGTLLQRFPGRKHSFQFAPDQDVALTSMRFAPASAGHVVSSGLASLDAPLLHTPLQLSSVMVFEHYLRRVRDCPWEDLPMLGHEMLAAVMRLLRHARQGSDGGGDPLLAEARRLLRADIARRLDMPSVARSLQMSYSTFRQAFRRETGLSPKAYRIRARLRRARELLADGRYSLQEVGRMLGYADYFCFSKQFTQHEGISPSEFLRRRRNLP
jgi:AraC-like DNA-binding protein